MKIKKNTLYEIMDLIKYLTECRCATCVYTEEFQYRLDYVFGIEIYDDLQVGNTKIIIRTHRIEITLYLNVIDDRKFKLTDYIIDIRKKG